MSNETKEQYDQKVITLTIGAQYYDIYRKKEYIQLKYRNFTEYLHQNHFNYTAQRIIECVNIYSMVERCDLTIYDIVSYSDYHLNKIARYVHRKNYKDWFEWLDKSKRLPSYKFRLALAKKIKNEKELKIHSLSSDVVRKKTHIGDGVRKRGRPSIPLSIEEYDYFMGRFKTYKQQMGVSNQAAVLFQLIKEHEIGLNAYDLETILNHLNTAYPNLLIEVSTL